MEHDPINEKPWSRRITEQIGRNVAHWRQKRTDEYGVAMTAQALSDRCRDLGHPMDRGVIAKLERGHRHSVSVADLLVLAAALNVPPVVLVFPVDREGTHEALPNERAAPIWAAEWFVGMRPLDGSDDGPWMSAAQPLKLLSNHDQDVELLQSMLFDLKEATERATKAEGDARPAAVRQVEILGRDVHAIEDYIRTLRDTLRERGITPPGLPPSLVYLDAEMYVSSARVAHHRLSKAGS